MGVPEENIEEINSAGSRPFCLKCLKPCDYPQPGSPRSRNSDGSTFSVPSRRPRNATLSCRSYSRRYVMRQSPTFCGRLSALDWYVFKCSDSRSVSSYSPVELHTHNHPHVSTSLALISALPLPSSLHHKYRPQSTSMARNPVARRSVTRRHRMRRCQMRLLLPDNTCMKSAWKFSGGMQRKSYRGGAHRLRAVDMKQPYCHILSSDAMCCEALHLALATAQPRQYILEHIYISLWTSCRVLRWCRL
jgi:hypothetical protein